MLKVFAWSMQALSESKYPEKDHERVMFGPGHYPDRAKVAGQDLAGPYKGAWAEMRGDWEFIKTALSLSPSGPPAGAVTCLRLLREAKNMHCARISAGTLC